jgi:hypothetical protein
MMRHGLANLNLKIALNYEVSHFVEYVINLEDVAPINSRTRLKKVILKI